MLKCGNGHYDPAVQFCNSGIAYAKCGGQDYDPETQGCENNVLLEKCGSNLYDPETHFCIVNAVLEKCNGEIYEDPANNPCNTYTITINYNPAEGSVTYTPNQTNYASGTPVTITAEPLDGYEFTGWSVASTSKDSTITIIMDGDKTLTANFRPTYTLTVTANSDLLGTVSLNPNNERYSADTEVTLKATPVNSYYKFTGWSGADDLESNATSVTITMDENKSLTANFEQLEIITVGNLRWTAENLNYETDDSWCYEDDPDNCVEYGRLYTWEAAKAVCKEMDGDTWRLPDNDEWLELVKFAENDPDIIFEEAHLYEAGTKLKSSLGWDPYAGIPAGTDDISFSALPGGHRLFNQPNPNPYGDKGIYGYWWSLTTTYNESQAYVWRMSHQNNRVDVQNRGYSDGRSVRCVRND